MATPGEDYLPSAEEALELALKRCYRLIAADSTPAHVASKCIGEIPKLVAAQRELKAPEAAEQTVSIFDRLEGLPPARAAELLRVEIAKRDAQTQELRLKLERLESPLHVVTVPPPEVVA